MMAIKVHHSIYLHPGPWLRRQFVEPYQLTIQATATALGVTRVAMSKLLNGKVALSAEMALRFEKAFGISAETLLRMQSAYDLFQARAHADQLIVKPIAKRA